ncbi:hypothetical protein GCM10020367_62630 [Streptomyces sannanensis]|uniref:Small CPxCG-related zinc finger protein n=1 Tax=Streptomyces sannanensis TaxID=285536 RepID=A0ABP6SLF2_9ACTN
MTDNPETCPECGSEDLCGDLTAYSYDGGKTVVTGYECRDCGHNWRA